MVVFLVFLGLILIRVLAIGLILLAALNVGPECPACGGTTLLMRTRWLRRQHWLQRRWCLDCGWEGLLRRGPRILPTLRRPIPERRRERLP